jgi:hypothetical protein
MRYQVIGKNHKVFGKASGEYFERDLPDAQERTLIGGGFIVRAPLPVEQSTPQVPFFPEVLEPVVFPAEPSVSEDASSEAPEEAPTDNPEGMSSSV